MSGEAQTPKIESAEPPSNGRWSVIWRWRLEEWRLLFNGFQALAALSIAGLAVYGVFFTSIPETIVRQLRADVADAKEELSGLRAERNRLLVNLDTLNVNLREATEKSKRADAQVVTAMETLAKASSDLASTREQLAAAQKIVETLRSAAEMLRAERESAQGKLQQLQGDIAKLTADRERYLKVARLSDFAVMRARLEKALDDYRDGILAAEDYLAAPRWEADEKAALAGLRAGRNVTKEQLESQSQSIEMLTRRMRRALHADRNNLDTPRETIGTTIEAITAYELARIAKFQPTTGRALILELVTTTASLTPADLVAYRQFVLRMMQSTPALDEQLLVQRELILQRGDLALREIVRAQRGIAAVNLFVERLQGELKK